MRRLVFLGIALIWSVLPASAATSFVAFTTATFTNATGVSINKPAGTADNDLLIFWCASDTVHTAGASMPPTDWNQIGTTQDVATTDSSVSVFYRVAASEGASYNFTNLFAANESGICAMVAYTGNATASPIDQVLQGSTASSSTHELAVGITPTVTNSMIVNLWGSDPTDPQTTTDDASPDATERVDAQNAALGYVYLQDYAQVSAVAVQLSSVIDSSVLDTTGNFLFNIKSLDSVAAGKRLGTLLGVGK